MKENATFMKIKSLFCSNIFQYISAISSKTQPLICDLDHASDKQGLVHSFSRISFLSQHFPLKSHEVFL